METKVEGLLISKVTHGERNVIGKLLLRSGKIISVIFYGGLGGGKKMKPSTLELGFMFKVDLKSGKFKTSQLFTAKEWKVLWEYHYTRLNHEAYYLMCFYLETILKISANDDLYDSNREYDDSLVGIFRVLSNAIFYLEDAVTRNIFDKATHLSIFISKLIKELGVSPLLDECVFCKGELDSIDNIFVAPEHGSFICGNCIEVHQRGTISHMSGGGKDLHRLLRKINNTKYKDYMKFEMVGPGVNQILANYFFFQFNLEQSSFKTIPFVL